ncbi:MAG: hypothetical protein C0179_02020, partial [Fervidicoccus sp.]
MDSSQLLSAALIFIVALLPLELTAISNAYSSYSENPYFSQEIYVVPEDENGRVLRGAHVYLYAMLGGKWVLLGERSTGALGIASFRPSFPLDLKAIADFDGRRLNVYGSINLMAIVQGKDYIGLYTIPLDPTFELGSPKIIEVKAYPISSENLLQQSHGYSYERVLNEWYQYTPVLRYSTYHNISAEWVYPVGSKVRVQTLWAYPPGSSVWRDGGYVEITMDCTTSTWLPDTGPYIWTLEFYFKYRHSIEYGSLNIEYLYAVDTSDDPKSERIIKEDWLGTPVSGQYYRDVWQGDSEKFNVTGGY